MGLAAKAFCVALLVAASPLAQGKLIFFGDSWTDGGNTANFPGGILSAGQLVEDKLSNGEVDNGIYPPSPYYQGTFTNGPIWASVAASNNGQKADIFAAGGSTATAGGIVVKPPYGYVTEPTKVPVRSLVAQAEALVALKNGSINPSIDFVVIFTGIDEIYQATALKSASLDAGAFGDAIGQALSIPASIGVTKFAVLTIPPLESFPFANNASNVSSAVGSYNAALQSAISSFNGSNADATVLVYNTSTLFSSILSDPTNAAFGTPFTNTKDPARISEDGDLDTTQAAGSALGNVANPAGYVFWDEVHGTKHLHHVLANDFSTSVGGQLNSAPAPAGTYT